MTVPHIFTLTGNLLAEYTLEFTAWSPGKAQRASRQSFQVGGKGINVSKMLGRLGLANTALCFTGGATGAQCESWLREHHIPFTAFAADRATRIGTVVRGGGADETTFLGVDAIPSASALQACAGWLDAQPAGQILAVCGSLPGWAGPEFDVVRESLTRWMQRGILAVDTYGPPLAWFAERPMALIKINATELATLAGGGASVREALAAAAMRWPVQRWIVSDGPGDVHFANRSQAPESLTPPLITEVSATGSGDVLFACVLQALFLAGAPLSSAVALAMPYAAANAAHPGVADFPFAGLPPLPGVTSAAK